ncbi:MAG: ABC transporter ATP-binding protein [Alphaproteobacteria bacterium]|nr:ABC transporter ATP-binding protein [Alphaproteobacteria bacterium]
MSIAATGQPVAVERLSKRFGEVVALDDVSFEVRAGEFLALLGPSGSGKSTVLMSIAGFVRPDAGRIRIGGRVIDDLPPHRRDIGMVFQRYALFPHLSVAENLAYPLRRRGIGAAEIARRVEEVLALVRLGGYGARGVDQISGGQQQRVAIARALIFRPAVLLMDEPMSALDRKLRQHMQMELKLLHREVGATIVLVTHDQEEALSMADRVAVLDEGRLRQIGVPEELYREPADAFVAGFIGQANFLPYDAPSARVAGFASPLGDALPAGGAPHCARPAIGVRPEDVTLHPPETPGTEPCRVVEAAFGGSTQSVLVAVGGHRLTARMPAGSRLWRAGEEAGLRFRPASCRVFDLPAHQPSSWSNGDED